MSGRPADKPCVAVGVGNTSIQLAYFSARSLDEQKPHRLPQPEWHAMVRSVDALELPGSVPDDVPWRVASVNREACGQFETWLRNTLPNAQLTRLANKAFDLQVDVLEPDRVGADRLAAAMALRQLQNPGKPAIFVDAGTAMTVNALDGEGRFVGGAIWPGTLISARAMSEWVDQLPLLDCFSEPASPPTAIGRSTELAMQSGLYWSAIGGARELISRFERELSAPVAPLIVTGGFGPHLARNMERAEFIPHLVVAGIALATQ